MVDMRNVLLLLVLFFETLAAEVAYLPLTEQGFPYPLNTSLGVYDLDAGLRLKKIEIGHGVGPVFLNDSQDTVYVAARYENKILAIDTTTLTPIKTWQNLPTNPDQIFLSQDNSKLFFINLNVGTGQNSLYQIDLMTDVVNEVLFFPGFSIEPVVYSQNLQYMALYLYDYFNNERRLVTYQTNDMILVHDTPLNEGDYLVMIDNEGEGFFYKDVTNAEFVSKKLSDATENWRFSFPGETSFSQPLELVDGFLTIRGINNHYQVNKQTGQGSPIARPANEEPVRFFGSIDLNNGGQLIAIDYPIVICVTGLCSLSGRLNIHQVDVFNNNTQLIYQSSETLGSNPVGRFIGQRFFRGSAGQPVPLFEHFGLIALLMVLMVFVSYKRFLYDPKSSH